MTPLEYFFEAEAIFFFCGYYYHCLIFYKLEFVWMQLRWVHFMDFQGKFDLELEGILKNASTKHKTVILTTLNQAWAEPGSIFDLFLESFQVGDNTQKLVNNLIIISMDQKAHARCLAIHPHCYALRTEGLNFSSEAYFMSEEYLKMMWRRIEFLGTVLEMGYSFVFTV